MPPLCKTTVNDLMFFLKLLNGSHRLIVSCAVRAMWTNMFCLLNSKVDILHLISLIIYLTAILFTIVVLLFSALNIYCKLLTLGAHHQQMGKDNKVLV